MMAALIRASSRVRPRSRRIWGRASDQASESVTGRPSTERLITTVSTEVMNSVAIIVMSVAGPLAVRVACADSVAWRMASAPVAFGSTDGGSGRR
ncbi:hypothetical protein ACVWXU_005994 [Streptomyces sp. TE33382]